MNTFVPVTDFNEIAELLDDRRLNRQRTDITALLRKLMIEESDDDHALVKMWRGNERFLCRFGVAVCMEHQARGNAGQTAEKILEYRGNFDPETDVAPEWWGDEAVHDSHKSYLVRQQPSHYRQFWPEIADDLPMIYPRSPEKSRKSPDRRERDKLIKKAYRAKDKADAARQAAIDAAHAAGLDPDTLEAIPDDELEMETIKTPDDELLEL